MQHILVVGATQGIGAATAKVFAASGASVTIIGRNEALGAEVVGAMKALAPNAAQQLFEFHKLDVTSISSVKNFCSQFRSASLKLQTTPALNGLVLCAGGLNYGPRRETAEGIEMTLAMNYLSRFVFVKELLPLLSGGGRVVNCLGAGNGGPADLQDLQLKSNFSFIRASSQHATLTDVITSEFARRHNQQGITFYHMFPGIVNTNSAANQGFPWFIAAAGKLALPLIGSSPESVAKKIQTLITADEFARQDPSSVLIGSNGKPIKLTDYVAKGGNELGRQVWDATVQLESTIKI
eukprot:jgi/Hompol1/7122/HPOL_002985-RA